MRPAPPLLGPADADGLPRSGYGRESETQTARHWVGVGHALSPPVFAALRRELGRVTRTGAASVRGLTLASAAWRAASGLA